jgi:hypothetical protein
VVVVLIVINVGLGLLDAATRGADQARSRASSFSTSSTGTAGYAQLLGRYHHPTTRARGDLRVGSVAPDSTIIVLDAGAPDRADRRAITAFVATGGRLVVGGSDATDWTKAFRGKDVRWTSDGTRRTSARVGDASYRVRSDGDGSWVVDDHRSLTVETTAPGAVVLLADTSPLQNRRIDQAENAAFGVALAGVDGRPVVFVEGPHGFGGASGFDVIPARWKFALVGGALAALLTLIAASRRLGPPEEIERTLPPARRVYVDALGTALAHTRRTADAVAPLQAAARNDLAQRAGLPSDATPESIRAAAAREGWTTEEIDALFTPATDNERILAAGRALARAKRGAT